MDIDIKKDLTSNWFKLLQNAICDDIKKLEKNKFKFKSDDTILFGRESAGVPEKVHKLIKDRLKIPMNDKVRSLNIASSVAIVLAESLRQIKLI